MRRTENWSWSYLSSLEGRRELSAINIKCAFYSPPSFTPEWYWANVFPQLGYVNYRKDDKVTEQDIRQLTDLSEVEIVVSNEEALGYDKGVLRIFTW